MVRIIIGLILKSQHNWYLPEVLLSDQFISQQATTPTMSSKIEQNEKDTGLDKILDLGNPERDFEGTVSKLSCDKILRLVQWVGIYSQLTNYLMS